jgi:hypothetical protein
LVARPADFMVDAVPLRNVAPGTYLDVDFLMGEGPYLR